MVEASMKQKIIFMSNQKRCAYFLSMKQKIIICFIDAYIIDSIISV